MNEAHSSSGSSVALATHLSLSGSSLLRVAILHDSISRKKRPKETNFSMKKWNETVTPCLTLFFYLLQMNSILLLIGRLRRVFVRDLASQSFLLLFVCCLSNSCEWLHTIDWLCICIFICICLLIVVSRGALTQPIPGHSCHAVGITDRQTDTHDSISPVQPHTQPHPT